MSEIQKNEEEELPIPEVWRETFVNIVEAFRVGDFRLFEAVKSVHSLNDSESKRIKQNIEDYGDPLESLPKETWNTSIYRWMRDYWMVLIDLYTRDEGASDLVMFVKVREKDGAFCFTVESVHVP